MELLPARESANSMYKGNEVAKVKCIYHFLAMHINEVERILRDSVSGQEN